jgi:hypothetical protein
LVRPGGFMLGLLSEVNGNQQPGHCHLFESRIAEEGKGVAGPVPSLSIRKKVSVTRGTLLTEQQRRKRRRESIML